MDDNSDLTSLLALLLNSKLGLPCHCYSSFAELEQNADQALRSALAILDINLGHNLPTGLDALHWLRAKNFPGQIFMLTGHHQSNPLVKQARALEVMVYEKPLKTETLLEIIQGVLKGGAKCEISSK